MKFFSKRSTFEEEKNEHNYKNIGSKKIVLVAMN
jgi:hypothetical protein